MCSKLVCLLSLLGAVGATLFPERLVVPQDDKPDSELFSSVIELEKVDKLKTELKQYLQEYVENQQKKIDLIKKYIEENEETKDLNEVDGSLNHPLNAYVLIRKFVIDWQPLLKLLSNDNDTDFTAIKPKIHRIPTDVDLFGAAKSLILLQETYHMKLTEMAKGVIHLPTGSRFAAQSRLNGQDLAYLGKHAFNIGQYNIAVEMLQLAANMSQSGDISIDVSNIMPFLQTSIKFHDIALQRKGPLGKEWRTNPVPFNPELQKKKKYRNKVKDQSIQIPLHRENLKQFEKMELYHQLCRGEQLTNDTHTLKCHLLHHGDPYLRLGPFKIEEHHLAPYIITVKQIISDREADIIKHIVSDRLFRSKTGNIASPLTSHIRTSKQSWLSEDEHPVVAEVSRRVELLTRLRALPEEMSAERYQVANYGIGGRYTVHLDALAQFNPITGNRLATFMAYLNDVQAGGGTVFPLLGVSISPKKGDAAFWFGLTGSGERDQLSLHGGCPVLVGSKWILNKWFFNLNQMDKYPCPLDINDRLRF